MTPLSRASTRTNFTIAVTADIHFPISALVKIYGLIRKINEHKADLVILAGDIAENRMGDHSFRIALGALREGLSCPILVFAGNHDLWTMPEGPSSTELFSNGLPRICRELGCEWGEESCFRLGSIGIVGSYLHYDYSAAEPSLGFGPEYYAQNKRRLINDAKYMRWDNPASQQDENIAQALAEKMMLRLKECENSKSISRILLVTHVPCLKEQIARKSNDFTWSIGNAYFGNISNDASIKSVSKLAWVISGHTHVGKRAVYNRIGKQPIDIRVIGSDYGHPATEIIKT